MVTDFGSVENAVRGLMADLATASELESELTGYTALRDELVGILESQLRYAIKQLADVDRWKTLAAADRKKFRSELSLTLRLYQLCLSRLCGIESHRPRANEERDAAVIKIKQSNPKLSFGQVAIEYKRKTGQTITPKVAERICNRAASEIETFLSFEWLGPLLKTRSHKTP
jgi:hypothetical protein